MSSSAGKPRPATRAGLGFLAAALSVLTFHAAMWWLLYQAGLMPPPYPMEPTPPFGVPVIASLVFWGGLYGVLFGLALPRLRGALPIWGFGLGILACLVGWFVVAPLKGEPPADGSLLIPIVINGFWGIGVGILAPLMMPRRRSSQFS
ncbi:MAG TPA: hypothetical protein VNT30_23580 [Stellaceae bacterium]|nr:hypothetical protein [Stellaceae bacterium]